MKKIKDFFYDKNDIIIVLCIVAIAVLILYTRISAIMDYPEQYAKEAQATETKATTQITEPSETTESETTESESSDDSEEETSTVE